MRKLPVVGIIVAALAGCASVGNVVPMPDGQYQVDGVARSNDDALQSALHSAEVTCNKQSKRHIVTAEKTSYKGTVSEDTNRAIDKAALALASATGKFLPTLSNSDDYRTTLTFRCE